MCLKQWDKRDYLVPLQRVNWKCSTALAAEWLNGLKCCLAVFSLFVLTFRLDWRHWPGPNLNTRCNGWCGQLNSRRRLKLKVNNGSKARGRLKTLSRACEMTRLIEQVLRHCLAVQHSEPLSCRHNQLHCKLFNGAQEKNVDGIQPTDNRGRSVPICCNE